VTLALTREFRNPTTEDCAARSSLGKISDNRTHMTGPSDMRRRRRMRDRHQYDTGVIDRQPARRRPGPCECQETQQRERHAGDSTHNKGLRPSDR